MFIVQGHRLIRHEVRKMKPYFFFFNLLAPLHFMGRRSLTGLGFLVRNLGILYIYIYIYIYFSEPKVKKVQKEYGRKIKNKKIKNKFQVNKLFLYIFKIQEK